MDKIISWTGILATICATIGSLPVLVILVIALPGIEWKLISARQLVWRGFISSGSST